MRLRKVSRSTVEVYAETMDEEATLHRLSTHKLHSGVEVEKHDLGSLIYFLIHDRTGKAIDKLIAAQNELNQLIGQFLEP